MNNLQQLFTYFKDKHRKKRGEKQRIVFGRIQTVHNFVVFATTFTFAKLIHWFQVGIKSNFQQNLLARHHYLTK